VDEHAQAAARRLGRGTLPCGYRGFFRPPWLFAPPRILRASATEAGRDPNAVQVMAAAPAHVGDLADARLGRVRAKVTSAVPLAPEEAKRIAQKLAQGAGAEVIVETLVDEALLGGVVAQVGSLVYDGSVRSQLEELRRAMKH
jgi:hypothetical protein